MTLIFRLVLGAIWDLLSEQNCDPPGTLADRGKSEHLLRSCWWHLVAPHAGLLWSEVGVFAHVTICSWGILDVVLRDVVLAWKIGVLSSTPQPFFHLWFVNGFNIFKYKPYEILLPLFATP